MRGCDDIFACLFSTASSEGLSEFCGVHFQYRIHTFLKGNYCHLRFNLQRRGEYRNIMAGADKINPQQHPNASEAAEVPVDKEHDVSQVERVLSSASDVPHKDMTDYDRVDKDVAKYVHSERVEITPEENKRLRRMIDLRVLAIMVPTYFLQALDKGTISFASIMGIRADLGILDGQKV